MHRAAESLFSALLSSDCRICGLSLPNISRLPVCPECLAAPLRIRDTCSQTGLTSQARSQNLRGAFRAARATKVTGRQVLLVDDVYTTGTTVSECARVLRRAGASKLWVATVARTMKLASKYESFEQPAAADSSFKGSEFQGFKVNRELEVAPAGQVETLKL